jgi:hypothetical protein
MDGMALGCGFGMAVDRLTDTPVLGGTFGRTPCMGIDERGDCGLAAT